MLKYTVFLFLISLKSGVLCDLERIIDLTWDFDNDTVYWTGVTPLRFTKKIANYGKKGFWYAMNEFCAGEHGGTHFDAPYHFSEEGWKVGDVPIDRLIAKGAIVDLRNDTKNAKGNISLEVKHLVDWETENGPFEQGTVLLVRFGHSQYWYNRTEYLGLDENGKLNFPGISQFAAEWLAKSGKFYGVGVDTPSVDPGRSTDYRTHRILSEKQIYGLENVKLVEELPAKGFTLLVLPMKLREGTGGPLRILAVPKVSF